MRTLILASTVIAALAIAGQSAAQEPPFDPWAGGPQGWTIYIDGSAADHFGALTADGDGSYSRFDAYTDVFVDPVSGTTNAWDVRVVARQTIIGVWIPWLLAPMSQPDGAFFNTRLSGLRIDVPIAAAWGQQWALVDNNFIWQGDGPTYQYPGDYCFPGIGYDNGTTAT